jgi:hypothetical protein
MNRFLLTLCPGFMGGAVLLSLWGASPAQAQGVGSVGSLFLSPGSQLNFGLYGANGGQSDRIDVQNQFNFSSSSTGPFNFGFSLEDNTGLELGRTFTLVTFGSTNFTDTNSFVARPRGTLADVQGQFALVFPEAANNNRGSLLFTLTSFAVIPEPGAGGLLAGCVPLAAYLMCRRRKS